LTADRLVPATTCLGCGCACDDITVVVRGERIVEARNACELGAAWFGDGSAPARARFQGRDVPIDDALDAAARLLARAARPLVYLAPDISCEVQREGVAIADALRATLDSVTSATAMSSIVAAQERGRAGATHGEVRNRADLLVFWGVDPMLRYPRYWTRYAPEPAGLHVPGGRRARTVLAVDVGDSRGPADADIRIALAERDEVAMLGALSAMVLSHVADATPDTVRFKADATHDVVQLARELGSTLLAARYAVFVADAEARPGEQARQFDRIAAAEPDHGRADALVALTLALNGPTRCALSLLRAGGNRSGADAVATWQTGFPAAVDFARGYPRYRPLDGTAGARLVRNEVDAVLVIGSAACLPAQISDRIAQLPCVVMGPRASESTLAQADVIIDTGVAGIHEGGLALRMDDLPVSLRPSVGGRPSAAALAASLRDRAVRHRDMLRFKYPRRQSRARAQGSRSGD
jgi:formylmethanofuran dehydrogenase subunit B